MSFLGITRSVACLEKSKQFYEDVLGFEPDAFCEPTQWQSYKCQDGVFFAIGEEPGSMNEVSFAMSDVEALWERVKDKVDVVSPLARTPWGTYRFVV